ncbi:MAG TPA: diaminopimelate decarboxylase [Conexivisphaerales archaeon]|nr:diaminopimelate decarboxylase [Conexivisphaerales archaeon]
MDNWVLKRLRGSFHERDGVLCVEDLPATGLAERFGTPTFVTSEARIRQNFHRFYGAFGGHSRFRLYYAVKANTNLALLALLKHEGAYADCSCPAEIYAASLAGFRSDQMLYTGNYNTKDEIEYAIRAGVPVNLDDASLTSKLSKDMVPDLMCFRINPGTGMVGKEGLVFAGPDAKFGSTEEVAAKGYAAAKRLGVGHFGVHMMTGSNVLDPRYFPAITERLMDIAGRIAAKVGIEFDFVNVGGGFGVPYSPDDEELPIEQVAKSIEEMFRMKVEQYHLGDPILAAEPGRYLVADSTVILAKVCHVKSGIKKFVGLDAGMNTLLRPALYNAYHPMLAANRLGQRDQEKVNVCGQICENTDILAKDRPFPMLQEGDLIAIFNAGAYGFSMSSQYNNRPRAAEVLVSGGQAELTRRREAYADLFNGQSIPARLLR